MLFDLVDNSKKYYSFHTFVDECLNNYPHCAHVYGDYEYEIDARFSHYYKEEKVVCVDSNPTYSGYADASGFVTLSANKTYTIELNVFRRDRHSLNDEILRYAEYSRFWVVCLRDYCDNQLKEQRRTGRIENAQIPFVRKELDKIDFKKLDEKPLYAIEARKKVLKYYEMLGFHHPWSSGNYVYYQFFSTIKSDEEKAIDEEYKKTKKKDELLYIKRKEEAHFRYLDSQLTSVKLKYDLGVVWYHDLSKHEKFFRILSLIAIIILGLALFGLPAAIKEVKPDATFLTYVLYYLGTLALLSLPLIYFILKTKKRRNFKRAKKFNKDNDDK